MHKTGSGVLLRRIAATMLAAAAAAPARAAVQDYPTVAVADYVFGCLKANGETRDMMERCSCSIDVVASLLPYERYEEASTFLSMGQVAGEKGVIFRSTEEAKAAVGDLRRAQAEAEIRCF
jgi:hypothetical protein